jgi:hypothetical protein
MSIFGIFSSLFSSDNSSPLVNIDGAPMIPNTNIDVHGDPFGVTDSFNSSSSMFDSSNSFNSFSSFDS